MDRQKPKAAGGGVGSVDRLVSVALFCSACNIKFPDVHEHHFHQMTVHASQSEKDNDVSNPTLPRSFVPKSDIGPKDGQFREYNSERIQNELETKILQSAEEIDQPIIPPPMAVDPRHCGFFRGIQGLQNSCYFDVFFMILAFFSSFDRIFTQSALNQSFLLRMILFDVVIPLRERMFVDRDVIAMIRLLLAEAVGNRQLLGDVFDFTEFLMLLMNEVSFSNVCHLEGHSIECPIVLPVYPSESGQRVSIQEYIDSAIRSEKVSDKVSIKPHSSAFFVRVRPNFYLPPSALPQMNLNVNGSSYTLSAIVCIELSHYVVFLRLSNGEWVLIDSMYDMDNGHCIPTMTHVPNFENYLKSGCDEKLLTLKSDARPGVPRNSFHERVTKHAYAYLFTATSEVSKESECVGLPAEEPLLDARRMCEASQQTAKAQQPSQFSSQRSSAGAAAAVSEQPALPCRKHSAGGGAASCPNPPQRFSARGGAAAIPCYQSLSFFGHTQPIRITTFNGSIFPNMDHPDAFYDVMTTCLLQSSCPSTCKVTELCWYLEDICMHNVHILGSFRFRKGSVNYRYRVTSVRFDDNSEVKLLRSIDEFMHAIDAKWKQSLITSVTLEECSE